jgi:glycosyltransferase involved in cell wall biosynthesis
MNLSICIPFKQDFDTIESVVANIAKEADPAECEIIIHNDGSTQTNTRFRPLENTFEYPNMNIINSPMGYGVGYSFDRCVEQARGEYVILTASDVFPLEGWYAKVKEAVKSNPDTLGCAVCVGLRPDNMFLYDPRNTKRYGADLLFTIGKEDLPAGSPLRDIPGYSELFKGRWMRGKLADEPYDIPCLMGAFYFTSRSYFRHIGGWDTVKNTRWAGHQKWGSLEPYISLKSWLVGGGCRMFPHIEAGHVFSRFDRQSKWDGGVRGEDWRLWNQLFIMETQIMDEALRKRLSDFYSYRLNLGVARKWIRQNHDIVLWVREKNRRIFKNTPDIFKEKFGYKFH